MRAFHYQYDHDNVYKIWVDLLKVDVSNIKTIEQIPFLPIEFFKTLNVVSNPITSKTIRFTSSSTTSQVPASHYVNDIKLYEDSFSLGFERFYGKVSDYCILALLPNYLQRKGSSLVYMCQKLIKDSGHPLSGFFLDNIPELLSIIRQLNEMGQKTLLIGVSYALMDLCDYGLKLNDNFIVMETGGMKGTRKEMMKEELHAFLKEGLGTSKIHSEYGMTELLSQAYSRGDGLFEAPPWMRFLIREVEDPLKIRKDQKTGGINVIDLANINSCCFIATKDLGRLTPDNKLQLMGRYDNSDVRGCNLMLGEF
ncbi:MAG: acyl transferase [Bacteroidia bacterium]|nr:acyl transferase [Bacteroidia bacterium]